MPLIVTPRLCLVPLSRSLIEMRLVVDTVSCQVREPDLHRFGAGPLWPGESLAYFPDWAEYGPEINPLIRTIVAKQADGTGVAVGLIGAKHQNASGDIEIGYGINEDCWGLGYATEAVAAFVAYLHKQPDVTTVLAETHVDNLASQRVLAKCGFAQTGTRVSREHGHVISWAHAATAP